MMPKRKSGGRIWAVCIVFVSVMLFTDRPCLPEAADEASESKPAGYYTVKDKPDEGAKANEEIVWPERGPNKGEPEAGKSAGEADLAEGPKEEGLKKTADPKGKLKELISVSFKDMDLKEALSILAETYDLNILPGDDVKGSITINFKDVPLEDVLKQMLMLKKLTYKWEGSIIKTESIEEKAQTRPFSVSHITTDLAKEVIADKLSKDGKVKINTHTNQLIVTDTADKLDEIADVLKDIDVPPAQVRIETKLVDITHTDLDNLGVKWTTSTLNQPVGNILNRLASIPRFDKLRRQQDVNLTQADYTNSGTSADVTGSQFVISFAQGSSTLQATVDALVRAKRARLIANPSVTTVNNVEAKITIGEKYPIKEQTQTTTGTLQTVRFVDIGTTLKVMPKINNDGTIQMTIHPEVSSLSATITDGPRITTREVDTTVIVQNGDTLVIAGLLQTTDNLTKSHIPLLGSIPIIGVLFSSQDKKDEEKELVIMMTPHIINWSGKNGYTSKTKLPSEIGLAAERVNAVEIFTKAENLQFSQSLQMKVFPQQVRLAEAAKTYERVAETYPDSYYAEVALYRAAQIYECDLADYASAIACYKRIIEKYPKSPYLARAKRRVVKLEKRMEKEKKRQERAAAREKQ